MAAIERKQVPSKFKIEYTNPETGKVISIGDLSPVDAVFLIGQTFDSFWIERSIYYLNLLLDSEKEADAKREAAIQERVAAIIAA